MNGDDLRIRAAAELELRRRREAREAEAASVAQPAQAAPVAAAAPEPTPRRSRPLRKAASLYRGITGAPYDLASGVAQGASEFGQSWAGLGELADPEGRTPVGRASGAASRLIEYEDPDLGFFGKIGRLGSRVVLEGAAGLGAGTLVRSGLRRYAPRLGAPVIAALESPSRAVRGAATMGVSAPFDVAQGLQYEEGLVLPGRVGSVAENLAISYGAGAALPAARRAATADDTVGTAQPVDIRLPPNTETAIQRSRRLADERLARSRGVEETTPAAPARAAEDAVSPTPAARVAEDVATQTRIAGRGGAADVDVPVTPTALPSERAVELVDEWFNVPRLNLSDEAEAVFRENAAKVIQGNPDLLARRSVPFEEMKAAAREIGMRGSDADLKRIFNSDRLRGVDVLVARDVINTTAAQNARLLARRGEIGLTEGQIRLIDEQIDHLDSVQNALLSSVAREGSTRGRELAMLKVLARDTLDDYTWLSRAKRAVGSRALTPEEKAKIAALTKAGREGSEEASGELVNYVASLQKGGLGQQMSAVWKAFLLSLPRTAAVNVVGNVSHAALRLSDQPVATFYDYLLSNAMGTQRTTTTNLDILKSSFEGAVQGYREGIVMMGGKAVRQAIKEKKGVKDVVTAWDQAMRTGNYTSILQKYDVNNRVNISNNTIDLITKFVFGLQGASDMPFRAFAYDGALSELAHVMARNSGLRRGTPEYASAVRELYENPQDWMQLTSLDSAMEAVFAGNTRLASFFGSMKNYTSRLAQSENPLTSIIWSTPDFFIPFTRVPSGVATEVVMHSPLGFARAGEYLVDLLKTRKAGTPEEVFRVQRQLASALAKNTTGSALWLAGYWMASQGMLSGRRPTSPGLAVQQAEEGGMPFSFQIGDRYYSIPKALSPIGGSLALGAVMYEVANNDDIDGVLQQAFAMGTGVGAMAVETTAIGGVQDAISAFTDPRAAGRRVENIASTALVPQAVAGVARAFDPTVRETEGIGQAIQARIPIASRSLPARLDRFGRPITRGESLGERVAQVVDPFYSRPDRRGDDTVLAELGRVGVSAFGPRRAAKGETREQVRKRVEFEGPIIYDRLERVMRSSAYRDRPLTQARRLVSRDPAYADMSVQQVADELRREMLEREISRIRASSTRTLRRRGEIQ